MDSSVPSLFPSFPLFSSPLFSSFFPPAPLSPPTPFLTTVLSWEENSSAPLHSVLSHSAGLLIFGVGWTPQLLCIIFLVGHLAAFLASTHYRPVVTTKNVSRHYSVCLRDRGVTIDYKALFSVPTDIFPLFAACVSFLIAVLCPSQLTGSLFLP